jgi:hypothetical protein
MIALMNTEERDVRGRSRHVTVFPELAQVLALAEPMILPALGLKQVRAGIICRIA